MEVAILQAIRACEGILGQPRSGAKEASIERLAEVWRKHISNDIPPDEAFAGTGVSRAAAYHALFFNLRRHVAHHLEIIPFQVTRSLAITSQCLAWDVVLGYYTRNALSLSEAAARYKFESRFLQPPS